jgi:hypothetical protein
MDQKPNKAQLNRDRMVEREELEKLNSYNPFGRSGSGAPIRDHFGNIKATRRTIANDGLNIVDYSYKNDNNPNSYQHTNTFDYSTSQGYNNQADIKTNTVSYNQYGHNGYNMNDSYNSRLISRGKDQQNQYNQNQYMSNNIRPNYVQTPRNYNYNDKYNNLQASYGNHSHNNLKNSETANNHTSGYNGDNGYILPQINDTDSDPIELKKLNYKTYLIKQMEDKKYKEEMLKKQEREMERLEEEKYYQFL